VRVLNPIMICAAALLLAAGRIDNAAAAAESPFHDKPASPRSLPADNLPPFGMLDDAGHLVPAPPIPPALLHRGPGSPPESTAPGPTLVEATAAATAADPDKPPKSAGLRVRFLPFVGVARAAKAAAGHLGFKVPVLDSIVAPFVWLERQVRARQAVPA